MSLLYKVYSPLIRHRFVRVRRSYSTSVASSQTNDAATNVNTYPDGWDTARSYSEIPGPSKLQLIRWMLPGGAMNDQDWFTVHTLIRDSYGSLVKLPGMLGKPDMVFSFDPQHFETIFRTEGIWPVRPAVESWTYYRKVLRPDVFKDMGGLTADQGEPWQKMRTVANPVIMSPKKVRSYLPAIDEVTREFVDRMGRIRDANGEMPANFSDELSQWALESVGLIALDRRLGAMSAERNEDVDRLIAAVRNFFRLGFILEMQPPIWRYYKTKNFLELMASFEDMTVCITKYINEAIIALEKNPPNPDSEAEISVLQKLLEKDPHYAFLMTFDMIFAGIDTTASAAATFLHRLAVNPQHQEKLREEVFRLLPEKNTIINKENYAEFAYFRACLKESMRLQPQIVGNVRATGRNLILNGYRIPINTEVFMANHLLQVNDEYFPRSKEFLPERWLRDESEAKAELGCRNPFVNLPFGFGSRMCIGRRFAEMELLLLVVRILREYRVEWNYGSELKYANALVNNPITPLKFKLVPL